MAKYVVCAACQVKVEAHCKSPSCPWVFCPGHGLVALTPDQRRELRGE